MRIDKVINNNMVRSTNEHQQEVIVLGRGLGYQKHAGDKIDERLIEKVYRLEDKQYETQLIQLLSDIDFAYIQIVNEIVAYAESILRKQLNSSVYVSLTDHIYYSVERMRKNKLIENPLHVEIKNFYPKEYAIGRHSLKIIQQYLQMKLPESEASFIGMHVLNAQLNSGYLSDTYLATTMIQKILEIVQAYLGITLDQSTISYDRFITHLKFFSLRLMNNESPKAVDDILYQVISTQYKDAFVCAQVIKEYIENDIKKPMSNADLVYLTIHINVFQERIL